MGETTSAPDIAIPTITKYPIGVISTACNARNPRLRQPTPSVSAATTVCSRPGGRTKRGGGSIVTPISRANARYNRFHARPLITTSASSGMPTRVTISSPEARPVAKMNATLTTARTLISTT
jgi:hypothetical protein